MDRNPTIRNVATKIEQVYRAHKEAWYSFTQILSFSSAHPNIVEHAIELLESENKLERKAILVRGYQQERFRWIGK